MAHDDAGAMLMLRDTGPSLVPAVVHQKERERAH